MCWVDPPCLFSCSFSYPLFLITFILFILIKFMTMLAMYDLPGAVYALMGQCIGARLVTPRLHLASWHPQRCILPSGQQGPTKRTKRGIKLPL